MSTIQKFPTYPPVALKMKEVGVLDHSLDPTKSSSFYYIQQKTPMSITSTPIRNNFGEPATRRTTQPDFSDLSRKITRALEYQLEFEKVLLVEVNKIDLERKSKLKRSQSLGNLTNFDDIEFAKTKKERILRIMSNYETKLMNISKTCCQVIESGFDKMDKSLETEQLMISVKKVLIN